MQRNLISLIFLGAFACVANGDTIEIANNTNQTLHVDLPIPEHTAAHIQMKKLKAQEGSQEMLHQAILANSAEGIKKAVSAGANVNIEKDGQTPLLLAVVLKKVNAVEALLLYGANVNIRHTGQALIHTALKIGEVKIALLLVKHGAILNDCIDNCIGLSLCHCITSNREEKPIAIELLRELLTRGYSNKIANPNNAFNCEFDKRISNGIVWRPLFIAIEYFDAKEVKMLLDAGADVNLRAVPRIYESKSALAFAISLVKKSQIIEILLAHGATL